MSKASMTLGEKSSARKMRSVEIGEWMQLECSHRKPSAVPSEIWVSDAQVISEFNNERGLLPEGPNASALVERPVELEFEAGIGDEEQAGEVETGGGEELNKNLKSVPRRK